MAALRVVAAVVTHAAAPPSRRQPQSVAEVTAPGEAVALALWVEMDTERQTFKRPCDASGALSFITLRRVKGYA